MKQQIDQYIANGGKIQQCPEGAITEEGQLNYKFRRNSKSPTKKK